MAHDHQESPECSLTADSAAFAVAGDCSHSHDHSDDDHGHAHDNTHDHHDHGGHASRSRLAFAGLLTAAFMLAEIAGGILSGSLAILADAAHMFTDAGSLALAWFGYRLADRPADDRRSFGFARFRILAAFANGVTLILLSLWIVLEAVQRFFEPHAIATTPMLAVAVAGLVVNIIAFAVLHGGDEHHHDVNLQGALWHVAGDMLGSVAAIFAAGVIIWTGWTPIDPLLSVFVAGLVGWGGIRVLKWSSHILLEGAPDGFDAGALAADLVRHIAGVDQIRHVHAWSLSDRQRMITLHAHLTGGADLAAVRRDIRHRLADRHGFSHATIEIDELPLDHVGTGESAGGSCV